MFLHATSCGCEEKNRVLRRIFGPKMIEVTGGYRKLHSEGIHNFFPSPDY
jgi:hypothetical protein